MRTIFIGFTVALVTIHVHAQDTQFQQPDSTARKSNTNSPVATFADAERTNAVLVPCVDGRSFLISARRDVPNQLVAIPVDWSSATAPVDPASVSMRGRTLDDNRKPVLIDSQGGRHSLRDFAGRPRLILLIQGAFCEHCMAQLADVHDGLNAPSCPVIVLTATNDLPTSTSDSFAVFADPKHSYFKQFGAYQDGPRHGTVVLNARDEIVFKHVGDAPFMDIAAIKNALAKAIDQSARSDDAH